MKLVLRVCVHPFPLPLSLQTPRLAEASWRKLVAVRNAISKKVKGHSKTKGVSEYKQTLRLLDAVIAAR